MKKQVDDLTISIALSIRERVEAIAFIEAEMRKRFKCEPPPTEGVLCIARLGENIVGSIVLKGISEDGTLPIENHYEFDRTLTPLPFIPSLIVQGSRWIATEPQVSIALLRSSFNLVYELGKRYMLIEAKPYSTKRLDELGVACREINGATLRMDEVRMVVGDAGMNYYLTHPLPTLYMIDLERSILALT